MEPAEVIEAINRAWREGRFADLHGLLAPDVVMVAPDGSARVEGADACVGTFREFTAAADVDRFEPGVVAVERWDDVAVASYGFAIGYRMGGERHEERGRDIWVLRADGDGWRAVWRTQCPTADA